MSAGQSTTRQFELPAGTYVVFATAQALLLSEQAELQCWLASGTQTANSFFTQSYYDDLSLQGWFVLDTPADIELRCQVNGQGDVILTFVNFIAIEVDTVTEIENLP